MSNNASEHRRYWPLAQMIACRMREFSREPEAWVWTYGFPILMTVALGIAFRNQPVQQIDVDVVEGPQAAATSEALANAKGEQHFKPHVEAEDQARVRLRTGRTDVVVKAEAVGQELPHYEFLFDSTRPQSVLARNAADDQLQKAAGRKDVADVKFTAADEPGSRYIDFLVPGLLGVNLLGGGLWGVGFVTVEMRIRKLLKRFLATPMKKWQFLVAIMSSRFIFTIAQAVILLVFARYAFGVINRGSAFALGTIIVIGAMMFFGVGLLIASRPKTQDAIFGLMNFVQLPMWIFSGIFFSSDRFPDAMQPLVKALPLTPVIDSMRAVMLEGATLVSQMSRLGEMAAWGLVCFALGLWLFRWR